MQAKHQVQVSQSQQAQVARLLLQANLAYGESNSNGLSHTQRLKACPLNQSDAADERHDVGASGPP